MKMTSAEKILVAVDGSSHSDFALNWYAKHLHSPAHEVLLVYCFEIDVRLPYPIRATLMITEEEMERNVNKQREKANLVVEKYKELCQQLHLTAAIQAIEGKPGPELVRVATEENCRLIVVGTHGHGIIRRTILGSVSDYVLRHSSVPVAVCTQ